MVTQMIATDSSRKGEKRTTRASAGFYRFGRIPGGIAARQCVLEKASETADNTECAMYNKLARTDKYVADD